MDSGNCFCVCVQFIMCAILSWIKRGKRNKEKVVKNASHSSSFRKWMTTTSIFKSKSILEPVIFYETQSTPIGEERQRGRRRRWWKRKNAQCFSCIIRLKLYYMECESSTNYSTKTHFIVFFTMPHKTPRNVLLSYIFLALSHSHRLLLIYGKAFSSFLLSFFIERCVSFKYYCYQPYLC